MNRHKPPEIIDFNMMRQIMAGPARAHTPNSKHPDFARALESNIHLIENARPDRRARILLNSANELADYVRKGGLLKDEVIGCLFAASERTGLIEAYGRDYFDRVVADAFSERVRLAPANTDFDHSTDASARRELLMHRASEVRPEPIEWLWKGRIAVGKLTIIAGEPGLGKSQLCTTIAAIVTTGGVWPNGEGQAPLGNVIILSAEDDPADTQRPRLDAAGADLTRVQLITAVKDRRTRSPRMFDIQQDLDLLEAAISKLQNVVLVIIDPISAYLGRLDSHKNADIRAALGPFGELAARLGVAILAVTHLNKSAAGSANNRIIGSIGMVAAARSALIVGRDPDDSNRRLMIPSKNNIGPQMLGLGFSVSTRVVGDGIEAPFIHWDDKPVGQTADDLVSPASNVDRSTVRDAITFLKKVLAEGRKAVLLIEEDARDAGLLDAGQSLSQNKAFRKARKALNVQFEREGFGPGSQVYWMLPAA